VVRRRESKDQSRVWRVSESRVWRPKTGLAKDQRPKTRDQQLKDILQSVRDEALRRGVHFADMRFVETAGTSITREDGRADKLGRHQGLGVGVRVLDQGAWGFAHADEASPAAARQCLDDAISMAKASSKKVREPGVVSAIEPLEDTVEAEFDIDPRSVPVEEKMALLERHEKEGIAAGEGKLVNTSLGYSDTFTHEIVCNTLGTLVESTYVGSLLSSTFVAQEGDVRQRAGEHRAQLGGFEFALSVEPERLAVKAARRAVALLSARRAPAGKFTVVIHPSVAGLLAHEAVGHNAEADLVLAGESILEGKLGRKIANECITLVDDSTLPKHWGSFKYDSEGTPARRRVLIEKGILKGYLHSLETAARMAAAPTGSARAQGHSQRPIVRMSNTFIEAGEMTFQQLIKDVDEGILLKGGQWGYVHCERGQFVYHASEGFMISDGEVMEHVRDVSISGMTLEALMNMDAVSADFEMEMAGMCGKNGQGARVSGGGPYIRVRDMVVGGQERRR